MFITYCSINDLVYVWGSSNHHQHTFVNLSTAKFMKLQSVASHEMHVKHYSNE